MTKVINILYPDAAARYIAKYQTTYHQSVIDGEAYMVSADAYVKQFPPEDPAEWADLAVGIATISKDKQYLKTAMTWAENSLKQEETFECQLAKAYIFKAMGKKKKAKKAAEATIAWAKEKQENFAPATLFLSTLE
jgi:hypothetical protein